MFTLWADFYSHLFLCLLFELITRCVSFLIRTSQFTYVWLVIFVVYYLWRRVLLLFSVGSFPVIGLLMLSGCSCDIVLLLRFTTLTYSVCSSISLISTKNCMEIAELRWDSPPVTMPHYCTQNQWRYNGWKLSSTVRVKGNIYVNNTRLHRIHMQRQMTHRAAWIYSVVEASRMKGGN